MFSCGRPSTIWTLSEAAKKAADRSRSAELARPRPVVADYRLPRAVQWPVTPGARAAVATDRVEVLARAKSRSDKEKYHDQFIYSCGRPSAVFEVGNPIIHGVSEKTVQHCLCQNFVKFPSIVIIFGR